MLFVLIWFDLSWMILLWAVGSGLGGTLVSLEMDRRERCSASYLSRRVYPQCRLLFVVRRTLGL